MATFYSFATAAGVDGGGIPPRLAALLVFPGTGKSPRHYQVEDLRHLVDNLPRVKLLSDMGLGKTLPAQALTLLLVGWGNRVAWVMPPVLVEQFSASFRANFGPGLDDAIKLEFLAFDVPKRKKQLARFEEEGWPDVLCMSYKHFAGDREVVRTLNKRNEAGKPVTLKIKSPDPKYREGSAVDTENFGWAALKARRFTFVAIDEAQAVKNSTTEIWRAADQFIEPDGGCLLMTGTPVETNVEDAYGIIALCDPRAYGSKRRFDAVHCVFDPNAFKVLPGGRRKPYRKVIRYQNLDRLSANLFKGGRRVMKRDVVADMPPKVITEIQVALSPAHRRLYDRLVKERILEIGDRLVDATTASAMYQATQRIILTPDLFAERPVRPNTMLDTLDTLIGGLEGKKVLVFAWYRESVEMLERHLAALNPVTLYGGTSASGREKSRLAFVNDPTCRALIANYKSGGAGVDRLQEVCSHAVFAEVCPWNGAFNQATDRLWRVGQTEPVNIYLLVAKGTVSVKLRNDLVRKDSQENAVTRDSRTLLADLMGEEGLRGELK